MTTAHRPTFDTARGGTGRAEGDLSKLSAQYSSKDMPSHLTLKYRQKGQGTAEDIRVRDLRRELEEKEREHQREKEAKDRKIRGRAADEGETSSKKLRIEAAPTASTAADEDDPWNDGDDDDSDSDSDDDEGALLMAELARIRKERAVEKAEKEAQEKEEQERVRFENILQGNPLLQHDSKEPGTATEFKVKRRWDDDVVFKNCAKGLDERQKEPTFINDAIRSEFHRKFMDKYIK